jgi:hypothetical protein
MSDMAEGFRVPGIHAIGKHPDSNTRISTKAESYCAMGIHDPRQEFYCKSPPAAIAGRSLFAQAPGRSGAGEKGDSFHNMFRTPDPQPENMRNSGKSHTGEGESSDTSKNAEKRRAQRIRPLRSEFIVFSRRIRSSDSAGAG